jgi:HEAT repeat protein
VEKKKIKQDDANRYSDVDMATIKSLITDLGSEDGISRVRARKSLVDIGHAAVGPLAEAMASNREWLRWEAAKALAQIGDPLATQALIKALQDKLFDVRWLAAEGLIHIGGEAVEPLLKALVEHPDSPWMREGVHHILHELPENSIKEWVNPVLHALEDVEPSLEAAVTAKTALNLLAEAARK